MLTLGSCAVGMVGQQRLRLMLRSRSRRVSTGGGTEAKAGAVLVVFLRHFDLGRQGADRRERWGAE